MPCTRGLTRLLSQCLLLGLLVLVVSLDLVSHLRQLLLSLFTMVDVTHFRDLLLNGPVFCEIVKLSTQGTTNVTVSTLFFLSMAINDNNRFTA